MIIARVHLGINDFTGPEVIRKSIFYLEAWPGNSEDYLILLDSGIHYMRQT